MVKNLWNVAAVLILCCFEHAGLDVCCSWTSLQLDRESLFVLLFCLLDGVCLIHLSIAAIANQLLQLVGVPLWLEGEACADIQIAFPGTDWHCNEVVGEQRTDCEEERTAVLVVNWSTSSRHTVDSREGWWALLWRKWSGNYQWKSYPFIHTYTRSWNQASGLPHLR